MYNEIFDMNERYGSHKYLGNYRSSGGVYRQEHTLEPSFSKRSLEEGHISFYRAGNLTPQHNIRANYFADTPKQHPEQTLKDILSMGSKHTDGGYSNQRLNGNQDSDSMLSHTDIFRSSDLTNRKGLVPSSSGSRQDFAIDVTRIEHREEQLYQENDRLRNQNEELRRDLSAVRKQLAAINGLRDSFEKVQSEKRELERYLDRMGRRISDLEKKCDINQQESFLYRDIVDKLQKRVAVLLQENENLQGSVRKSMKKLEEFDIIQERLDKLRVQYKDLERTVQQDSDDWDIHKQLWINEREYYKEIIRKLQFQLNAET